MLETKAGSLGTAEDLLRRALGSVVEDEHDGDQARAKMNIGIAYQEQGMEQGYEAAEAEYRDALSLAAASGETELLGEVLFNLAQLLFYLMARPRDARTEAASAVEAYGSAGSAKESWARDLINEIDDDVG